MRKTALLILLFYVLCLPDSVAQSYIRTSSFQFSFPEGITLLEDDSVDNGTMLRQMEKELLPFVGKIQAGNYHLLIVAHVSAFNYANLRVVNKASLHASYLRAYILSRLNIPEECQAFYIDRSGHYRDKVHVYLVRSPLPVYANKAIYYSGEDTPDALKEEIGRYGGVPYVNLYLNGESSGYRKEVYVLDDPLFDRSEVEDYRLAIPLPASVKPVPAVPIQQTAPKVSPQATPEPMPETAVEKQSEATPPVRKERLSSQESRIGLSTNLLYWVALTPNLSFDWYFGSAFSIRLEGVYADWQTRSSHPKTWSVWEASPELRYWFWGRDYGFTGHYLGLYGHLGDFDFMFGNSKGFVGSYAGGGLSYGYVFPLGRALYMELGVRAGVNRVEYDTYYYESPYYFRDQPRKKYYLGPTGLHCSLIYRF